VGSFSGGPGADVLVWSDSLVSGGNLIFGFPRGKWGFTTAQLSRYALVELTAHLLQPGGPSTAPCFRSVFQGAASLLPRVVSFTTAASLAHELIEAKDERRLMRFQKMLSIFERLIIDELGFVPLSKTGAELLFEVFSRRYERSATLVTSNLPFERMDRSIRIGAADGSAARPAYPSCPHILEMNGESYRLKDSKQRRPSRARSY
jgi:hypothetical protein